MLLLEVLSAIPKIEQAVKNKTTIRYFIFESNSKIVFIITFAQQGTLIQNRMLYPTRPVPHMHQTLQTASPSLTNVCQESYYSLAI